MSELQSQAPPILPREAGAIGSGKRSGLVELLLKYSSFLQLYTHSQYLYLAESCYNNQILTDPFIEEICTILKLLSHKRVSNQ
ncbi:hypothetical protein SCLCIDRAFT_1210798 [Scleroderma citrinum Foug A]|uniref:Uncharacterized protein n=1 Tax=Scleroderma citrinum Foug A TaxID=1036808 RepID=A0A0C3AP62_9AGAM|nr:hypothetical protein SCLCIDRAFT_1210798 [Scleroderma citrinum Foug A]